MNNQSRLHPHYTLPGVMHYLQTEFTKNERDRITWELERAEMKARIAQLEGENKDLHYRLMKLDSQASGATRETETSDVSGDDLSDLLKSKMAVQESVKEIIYLFKSPEVASRFGSLNEERDSLHELQNLNLNQDLQSVKTQDELPVGHLSEANLHQANIKPESAYVAGTNPHDANSDAATVVLGSDTETNEWHDTRRRRSSSLFAPAKVLPVEPTKNGIDESKDLEAGSKLFRNDGTDKSESRAILQLKSFEDQIISYSEDGRMELWFIDSQLRISEKPVQSFQVVSSNFLDYYWFDSKHFLVFDDQGVKLYATRSTTPLDSRDVFKELNFNISNVVEHDYINSWFLFVSAKTIQLLEVSLSDSSPKEELAMGKSYTIDGERVILSARFGMTEKSLIVLYSDPCELVIYNYQGKILQRVDISKQLPSTGEKTRPSLILNKRSSKLLIGLADRVLVYSFDRKKVILNETLDSQPTNIIFKTVKNCMLFAYNNDIIEIRRLKDFKTVLRVPAGEHDESKKVKKITSLDCASVNSKTLIVTGFEDGTVTAQRKPDLIDD